MLRNITLKNFKSFTDITFNFLGKNKKPQNLVLIYGANGSGKTNFVDAFYFLGATFRTFNLPSMLADIANDIDNGMDPVHFKKFVEENSMGGLIKRYKTIGSDSNMVLTFSFLWHDKIGSYYMEFDNEQIVHEKLEYTLSKNKVVFFDISSTSDKFNATAFSGSYFSDLKELREKYWGKHSLISILYHLQREYSKEYSKSQFHNSVSEALDFFGKITCRLVDVEYKRNSIGYFERLLSDYDEGVIPSSEINRIKHTEKLINGYFKALYQDIGHVYYDIKSKGDTQLQYTLFFKKKMSGRFVDVKFDNESSGTQSLLQLLPFFVAVNYGIVAAIDEIDNGIHDLLLKELIESLRPCIDGQLIITTHNTLFLDLYELKDNIYIIDVDPDGYKTIKALSNNSFRVQKSSNVLDNYYSGRFGGIPKINPKFVFSSILE